MSSFCLQPAVCVDSSDDTMIHSGYESQNKSPDSPVTLSMACEDQDPVHLGSKDSDFAARSFSLWISLRFSRKTDDGKSMYLE